MTGYLMHWKIFVRIARFCLFLPIWLILPALYTFSVTNEDNKQLEKSENFNLYSNGESQKFFNVMKSHKNF